MAARSLTLQQRLRLTFMGLALVLLVIVGVVVVAIAARAAVTAAEDELLVTIDRMGSVVDGEFDDAIPVRDEDENELTYLGRVSQLIDGTNVLLAEQGGEIARLSPSGELVPLKQPPPEVDGGDPPIPAQRLETSGVEASAFDPTALTTGAIQTGRIGNQVFVARPLDFDASQRQDLFLDDDAVVIVATRDLGPLRLGEFGIPVAVAAALGLALALVLGFLLARRISQPLRRVEEASRAIADGDFSARIGEIGRADAEVQSLVSSVDTMAERLERAQQAQRAFLASVTHDLMTPLTSVTGYAELLSDGVIDDAAEQHDAAEAILREAHRLRRMVDDLLALARLDAASFTITTGRHDVAAIVGEAAVALRPLADRAGVTVTVDENGDTNGEFDGLRVGQIARNLVQNAIDFAGSKVTVSVQQTDGGRVLIVVTDDGPGLTDQDLAHVWERFYTSGDRREGRAGAGVGLAIVRELAELMGGNVRASNGPEGGASFVVELPLEYDATTIT